MNFFSTIKIALTAIWINKARSFLTTLGIVIGIASVILVFSAGAGVESLILGQIESFGTDFIQTEIKIPSTKKTSEAEMQNVTALAQGVQVTTLTIKDMEDINRIKNVKDSYAAILSQEQVSYGNEVRKAFLLGANASYIDVDRSQIAEGRFFTDSEDRALSQVVVLGSKMKEKLFGDSEAIDKFIRLHKSKYRVIGVMEERGAVMTFDFDDYVYVPLRTLQKKVMGVNHVLYMVHKLHDISLANDTAEEIKMVLRENHNISDPTRDDFRVTTMDEMMDMLAVATDALTLLLLSIVIISLIVGGVGIMNVMYVVVSERTKEIGLRKAVGANFYDIIKQFLAEAIFLTLLGGLFGVLFGVLFSYLLAYGANYYGLDWAFSIPIKAYVVALGFCLFFGLIFGISPAKKAGKMEVVEALRKE